MRVWYAVLALANLLAGGFLIVATYGFGESTAVNIGFGISIGVLVLGLAMGYIGYESKDKAVRVSLGTIGWLTAALAGWTIVATQVFDDDTARWLVFGSGCGHIALCVAGIITQEATAD
jgi:zinc transporter ZupT